MSFVRYDTFRFRVVLLCIQVVRSEMSDLRRLATFARCPLSSCSSVSCVRLANCGFFYAGQSDNLICQHCGVELSGWLETNRNPTVEHRCPSPTTTVADLPLSQVCQDHHDSTIYDIYVTVLQRAARNGVLGSTETYDLIPHDQPGQASTLVQTPSDSDRREATLSSEDDFSSCDTVTSNDSDDANDLTLKLLLAKRHSLLIRYCPCCVWCWWWQSMGYDR